MCGSGAPFNKCFMIMANDDYIKDCLIMRSNLFLSKLGVTTLKNMLKNQSGANDKDTEIAGA